MADVLVKHAFVSPYLDGPDATKLQPSHQNAALLLSGGVDGQIVTRDAAAATGASWTVPSVVTKESLGLGAVENTALSTWGGSPLVTGAYDVRNYGALGDGVANDTAAIQAAIDAAPAGGRVYLPRASAYYRISAALTITKALTIHGDGAEIRQVTAATHGLTITASQVTVRGLTMIGTQFAAQTGNLEVGIVARGASAAAPLTQLTIEACRIRTFGDSAISLEWVTDFRIVGNAIRDVFYAGVMGLSVRRGVISQNAIRNIVGTSVTNAYGIALTRTSSADLALYPRSSDVVISANTVQDIPGWEGIDTHAGQHITIVGNTVTNCRLGIVATLVKVEGVELFAPQDVSIVGNVIDSGVTDGSRAEGIQLVGATSGVTGVTTEAATGVIVGNTIRGHGLAVNTLGSGGILARNTQGLVVSGNTIHDASPFGVFLWYDNLDFTVDGNTVIDPWCADPVTQAVGIRLRDGGNRGVVSGNTIARGTKTIGAGQHAVEAGVRVSNTAPLLPWVLGTNQITGHSGVAVIDDGAAQVPGAGTPLVAASGLTGTVLAPTVVTSALTSVGTLAGLTVTAPIVGSITGSSGSTTGNAATATLAAAATVLATPRTINGVGFNGSANITVPADATTLTGGSLAATVLASSLTSLGTITSLTATKALVGDGTAGVPALAWTSEPTLGFWRNSAANLTLQGALNVTGGVLAGGNLQAGASAAMYWASRTLLRSSANGQLVATNFAENAGVGLDFATDSVFKIRTRAQSAYATVDALGYRASGVAGVSFGPAHPASITIVNGIVTACS